MKIAKRWQRHLFVLKNGIHENRYLQRAWNKYGAEAFKWIILEEVTDPTELVPTEQKWIDYYQAAHPDKGFNINASAYSPLGNKRTPEQRKQQSIRQKGRKCPWAKMNIKKALEHANHPRKLTIDKVCIIKARLARGDSPSIIASEFNVNTSTIRSIKKGKTWRYVTDFTPLSGEPVRPHRPRPIPNDPLKVKPRKQALYRNLYIPPE